jgi:hypothetical protein
MHQATNERHHEARKTLHFVGEGGVNLCYVVVQNSSALGGPQEAR